MVMTGGWSMVCYCFTHSKLEESTAIYIGNMDEYGFLMIFARMVWKTTSKVAQGLLHVERGRELRHHRKRIPR